MSVFPASASLAIYAAWTVGDLLVEYMDTHDGKWPRNWEDLQAARESRLQKGGNVHTGFEKLRSMVKIDWNVDPDVLATAIATGDKFTVKVVTQLDGSRLEANWGPDTEPNQKIA